MRDNDDDGGGEGYQAVVRGNDTDAENETICCFTGTKSVSTSNQNVADVVQQLAELTQHELIQMLLSPSSL